MSTMPISGPMDGAGTPVADAHLIGLLGPWSEGGHGSLARRLANALRSAITGGLLPGGTRLPPERHLADLLSVSRSTVTAALDELRGDGLLTSRQGRGTAVAGPTTPEPAGARVGTHFVARGTGIDLAAVVPSDGAHLPPMQVRTEDLVAATGQLAPYGLPALREALAARATAVGRPTSPGEVQVTHGAHHAISLVIDACAGPGAVIALESPTYPGILDLLDQRRLRAVALPGDAAGPDPEALARCLERDRPAVVYLQTGVHNPTGRALRPGRRRAIAEVLDAHPGTVVLEDEALADLVFDGRQRPTLADLCRRAPVVTVESVSKVAWAALRIGWVRATGVLGERIAQVRLATDLGASVPAQLLALQLLPHLDAMAETRRASLHAATGAAVARLRADIPEWDVVPPEGSSALWPRLPVADATPFVALARRHGVHVTPGGTHLVGGGPDPHLRICVDRPADVVAEGLDRLAAAWADASSRADTAPT